MFNLSSRHEILTYFWNDCIVGMSLEGGMIYRFVILRKNGNQMHFHWKFLKIFGILDPLQR